MRVLVIADYAESYNRKNLHGVGVYAREKGWNLLQHQASSREALVHALEGGVDALLLGTHQMEADVLLTRTSLPVVSWSATLSESSWPRVLPDDWSVGRKVGDHLLATGLKHFAYYANAHGIWVDRRREGFIAKLETKGQTVLLAPPSKANLPTIEETCDWLRALPLPIGIMLCHDPAAVMLLQACSVLGLRVPEDVAIVGVNDDDRFVEMTSPTLSSIHLCNEQIGYEAAQLLDQVAAKEGRTPWSILVPPGEVMARQSSDVLGSADTLVAQAVRYIRENLEAGVQTKQVVKHVGTCRATLNTRFVQAIGRSVSAEIRRARIERCRHLLSTTDVPMPEVASRAGFSSARQLSETFHHFTGMTPSAYRSQFKPGMRVVETAG